MPDRPVARPEARQGSCSPGVMCKTGEGDTLHFSDSTIATFRIGESRINEFSIYCYNVMAQKVVADEHMER